MAKKIGASSVLKKIIQWKVILGIQIVASLILTFFIFKLGALPMMYALIIVLVLALLCVGIFFLLKPNRKKKNSVKNLIGKLVSLLLSIILMIGSLYIAQGDSVLDNISGADKQTTRISVIVMSDSDIKDLSGLSNQTIEVNSKVDEDKMKEAIEALSKEDSTIKTKEQSDFSKMADDLYNGKTKAIYVNEAYYAMLEANHEDFETKTKAIWTYEIEEELQDISKNVDVTSKPFSVYISGIDTYGKVSTVSRSDVNMIVTVNPKTKQILMTSIPRDYYVTLANKGAKDKLTHSGLAGIENTVKTVENFMGIDLNYYARVNFTSLIKMVDALGGVDIQNDTTFTAYEGTTFPKGTVHVNGEKALVYSRERHALGGGDNARVHHQQIVLEAMLHKMMSPAIITNYSSVLKSIEGCFETNMSSKEITDLLQMQISDMASWNIVSQQLTGTGTMMTGGAYMPNNRLYYMVPNSASVSENKAKIQKVLKGEEVS